MKRKTKLGIALWGVLCMSVIAMGAVIAKEAATKTGHWEPFQFSFLKEPQKPVPVVTKETPGAILPVPGDTERMVPLQPVITHRERTLFFSDSPEYVGASSGLLYRGYMKPGAGRAYFYHVNESREARKMAIVVQNLSLKPGDVTISQAIQAGPSPAYFEVGRVMSKEELEGRPFSHKVLPLGPFEEAVLWPEVSTVTIPQDALFSGLVDFDTTVPLRVSIMMIPKGDNPLKNTLHRTMLPYTEGHLRGTFYGADRTIAVKPGYDPSLGSAYVEIANGREDDFQAGIDHTMLSYDEISALLPTLEADGTPQADLLALTPEHAKTQNTGNYGIHETISIPTVKTGRFALYFNPLGGAYAGSVKVTYAGKSKIWSLPHESLPYVGHKTIYESVYLGEYQGGETLTIDFMPAGASNLPVRFLLVSKK